MLRMYKRMQKILYIDAVEKGYYFQLPILMKLLQKIQYR